MLGFLNAPVGVAYHIVLVLARGLAPLTGGLATAAAIVVVTIGVRLLLSPLSFSALRGQGRMAAFQRRTAELRATYAGKPQRLQTELTALYQAEGGGLLAGCLPLLIQLPVFSVIYRLLESRSVAGHPNALLSRNLLAAPLGSHWLTGAGPASSQGLVFLGLFALLAAACYAVARISRAATARTAAQASGDARLAGPLGRIFPYLSVIIAAFVPMAAGLYLLTTTAWTAAERAIWHRRSTARDQATVTPV
jgi:YidC/Oxa1 family membrane protein insertase